jgi:hypothetical protein
VVGRRGMESLKRGCARRGTVDIVARLATTLALAQLKL